MGEVFSASLKNTGHVVSETRTEEKKVKMILKNKNSIRRINSEKELLEAFGIDEEVDIDPHREEHAAAQEGKLQLIKGKKPARKTLLDKNGFPILDKADDFSKLMGQSEDSVEEHTDENENGAVPESHPLKTRHGIQILEKDTDHSAVFQGDDLSEDFGEMSAESLGGKSTSVLLKEKRDAVRPVKKITEKQRLTRYPLPQGQIDLHGFTAIKADLNVEAYLRNAYRNGTYTVRVVVGKGLHSKDGPVLPDIVEKRVDRLKKDKIVFAYEWDKKKKSKSGSMTVFLNNYYSV